MASSTCQTPNFLKNHLKRKVHERKLQHQQQQRRQQRRKLTRDISGERSDGNDDTKINPGAVCSKRQQPDPSLDSERRSLLKKATTRSNKATHRQQQNKTKPGLRAASSNWTKSDFIEEGKKLLLAGSLTRSTHAVFSQYDKLSAGRLASS